MTHFQIVSSKLQQVSPVDITRILKSSDLVAHNVQLCHLARHFFQMLNSISLCSPPGFLERSTVLWSCSIAVIVKVTYGT